MKTTDNLDELFDVVDDSDNLIGQARRVKVHRNQNLIHRSIAVAVFNSKGELFLQKRSATKDIDPLLWSVSCAGHVSAGDSYERAVLRELKEELGIEKEKDGEEISLEVVAKYLKRCEVESEMVVLYKIVYDDKLILQSEEIISGRFFTQKALSYSISKGDVVMSKSGKIALKILKW